MRAIPTLQDFIDDELLRAPMTLELVVDAVVDLWRIRHSSVLRRGADPVRLLQQQRGKLVADSLRALRVATETEGRGATFSARPTRPRPPAAPTSLSLIGDDDVAVDIEIAHCTATAKLQAENELRDLQTYTSALVHDLNVSRDTNPFRPECFVQALWTGVQALPISRTAQAAFLHDAAAPLANQLRRSYASACQRLAEQGVTPAAHRTIVFGGGTAWGADLGRYRPPDDLNSLRDSMPAALDEVPRAPAHAKPVALDDARTTSNTAAPAVPQVPDPQLVELLARLFDAIQRHCGLAADTAALLKRLQPAVQRMALRDPSLLDTYDHPAWLFMNHLAHDIECSSAAHRLRLVGLGRNLVDHLVAAESPDGDRFDWALERLALARRQALAQVLLAAAPTSTGCCASPVPMPRPPPAPCHWTLAPWTLCRPICSLSMAKSWPTKRWTTQRLIWPWANNCGSTCKVNGDSCFVFGKTMAMNWCCSASPRLIACGHCVNAPLRCC